SSYKFNNAVESYDFKAAAGCVDDVIELVQDFRRVLIQGLNYHTVDWSSDLVWIVAKANFETETRYALVITYQLPDDGNPWGQGFLTSTPRRVSDNMVVQVERGDWTENAPGIASEITSDITSLVWQYQDSWQTHATLPIGGTGIFNSSNGNIFIFGIGGIQRSTNDGDAWSAVYTTTYVYGAIAEHSNGHLFAGAGTNGDIIRSVDDGATWATVSTTPTDDIWTIISLANGDLLAGGLAQRDMYRSVDDGATWAAFTPVGSAIGGSALVGTYSSFFQSSTGTLFGIQAAFANSLYMRSTDNGVTWNTVYTRDYPGLSSLSRFQQLTNGNIIGPEADKILTTTLADDGLVWSTLAE
ncbi:MAG: exo-alpha-sialidase, partial [Planctomycetes bacterium]|nr:exo-alpha-sialidase [Planctomycetota bacterium]